MLKKRKVIERIKRAKKWFVNRLIKLINFWARLIKK